MTHPSINSPTARVSGGQMKRCSRCGAEKPTSDFNKNAKGRGGLDPKCKACIRSIQKKWRDENKEQVLKFKSEYRDNNRHTVREWHRKDRAARRDFHANAKRELLVAINQRTPDWLTSLHKRQIKEIYGEAKKKSLETGVHHHVDHIVPLRGEIVSGLHVPWNLRVVTAKENQEKGNKL